MNWLIKELNYGTYSTTHFLSFAYKGSQENQGNGQSETEISDELIAVA